MHMFCLYSYSHVISVRYEALLGFAALVRKCRYPMMTGQFDISPETVLLFFTHCQRRSGFSFKLFISSCGTSIFWLLQFIALSSSFQFSLSAMPVRARSSTLRWFTGHYGPYAVWGIGRGNLWPHLLGRHGREIDGAGHYCFQ